MTLAKTLQHLALKEQVRLYLLIEAIALPAQKPDRPFAQKCDRPLCHFPQLQNKLGST